MGTWKYRNISNWLIFVFGTMLWCAVPALSAAPARCVLTHACSHGQCQVLLLKSNSALARLARNCKTHSFRANVSIVNRCHPAELTTFNRVIQMSAVYRSHNAYIISDSSFVMESHDHRWWANGCLERFRVSLIVVNRVAVAPGWNCTAPIFYYSD